MFWGIFFSGIVISVIVVSVFLGAMGNRIFDGINKRMLERFAGEEPARVLLAKLGSVGVSSYLPVLLSPLSALNVYGLMVWSDTGLLVQYLTVASTFYHGIMFVAGVGAIVLFALSYWNNPRLTLPSLWEYIQDKEALFLFWLAGKEDDYETDFLQNVAVFPEHLVPILENWASVEKYACAYERLRKSLKGKEEYLSPRQHAQQKELLEELREKTKEFVPFYQLLLDAVNKESLDEKEVKRIKEIKGDIPTTLEQMANEIHSLEQVRFEAGKTSEKAEDGIVLNELRRVAESDTVSADMRKDATELVAFIESRQQKEVMEREREIVQMDALAVIQASRLFYGISEEELERE